MNMPDDKAFVPAPENGPPEDFVQSFTRSQRRLYLYVLSQVPNPVDADEILQDTNVVIWKKSQQYEPGTNFFSWAARIAHFEILKYRDRWKRERLQFSAEFVAQVAEEIEQNIDAFDQRRDALMQCLRKLKPEDRQLIQQRYTPGQTGQTMAEDLGRPANSIYQSLSRIRRALAECVARRLAVT